MVADHDGHDPDEISHDWKLLPAVAQKVETTSVTGLGNKIPRDETHSIASMTGPSVKPTVKSQNKTRSTTRYSQHSWTRTKTHVVTHMAGEVSQVANARAGSMARVDFESIREPND